MKRILAILLVALMLCAIVACDETEQPSESTTNATKAPTTQASTTQAPTTQGSTQAPGTDAGTEAPDATEPGATDSEQTTEGDAQVELEDFYVDAWDSSNVTHNPQAIDANHKGVGVCVTIPEGGYLYEASVQAPSYSDDYGSLSIKVFAWNTDFDTTVAGEPLHVEEFVDFADNDTLIVEYEADQIGAGKILILVCDGVDEVGEGVGVWMGKPFKTDETPEENIKFGLESWINGKQSKKSVGKISLIITAPEE